MQRVIVTGGAGFIGSHLVDELLRRGDEVVCIDDLSRGSDKNLESAQKSKNLQFVKGDLTSLEFANSSICDADLVYHLAAVNGTKFFYEKPRYVIETNIKSTENVLSAAAKHGIKKIVFSSTSEVYGRQSIFPTPETAELIFDPPDVARWSYAVSKLSDEHLCYSYAKEFGISVTCVRIFNTYGPRLLGTPYGQVVSIFVKNVLSGNEIEIFGDGEQTRSFCYVSDTVNGIISSGNNIAKGAAVFNIGSESEVSINRLAEMVISACGSSPRDVKIRHLPALEGDSTRRVPSIKKARTLLNYEPKVGLERGLKLTIDWFRAQSK
jgi:nucleoside-diphosphate-sugar epimerase